MRAGPLSNAQVVRLLNRYFVPVYLSNEDYAPEGPASPEEKAERRRIYREAGLARLSAGTAHVYLLAPDGHPMDSLHVAQASRVENLLALCERWVARLDVPAGQPPVQPTPQSRPAKGEADDLVLHLTARYLLRKGNNLVPFRGEVKRSEGPNAGWQANPAENWVVLPRAEWTKLLRSEPVKAGTSWELDPQVVAKLLTHFYPPTENNDVSQNRFEEQSLKATVLSVTDGVARVRLNGRLKMKHSFYDRDDNNVVESALVGFLEYQPVKGSLQALYLVTDGATYEHGQQRRPFGVAVRALSMAQ